MRLWLLFLAVSAFAGPAAAAESQPKQDPSAVVWCHDAERSIVSRKRAWKCRGRIVDEAEAQKIQIQRARRLIDGFEKPKPLFENTRLSGSGTGFYVSTAGHILTNHHVIDNCTGISVAPAGQKPLIAQLIATNPTRDLALLQTLGGHTNIAAFRDPPEVPQDEDVLVVGYPLHGKVTIKPILVSGKPYKGKRGPGRHRFAMKIDIRRGNSGGPVMDRKGRILGVVVAKVNTPHVFAKTGKLVQDLGVAIRSSIALQFLRQHDVRVVMATRGTPMDDDALFDHAHRFVGQVGCWR